VTDLGALAGGQSSALAINNQNLVVGYSMINASVAHAVLWRNGRILDIGAGTADSCALSVNDHGLIVGESGPYRRKHAVLWRDGVMLDLNQMLVGASGWILTEAQQINARGQIIAQATKNHNGYAVLLTPINPAGKVRSG
jgi:probable HAF family extracellular repeat protein